MTAYKVTVEFVVEGKERHAAKIADKVENIVLGARRTVRGESGSYVDTTIQEQK